MTVRWITLSMQENASFDYQLEALFSISGKNISGGLKRGMRIVSSSAVESAG